eukprot:GHRQ01032666.1.p1 GENE.GHRQ01032666.1~~GHRQ01032666.1.p1  ORF type:complete len:122 (-),score=28.89 GHRQ01032666.1:279-644(-)
MFSCLCFLPFNPPVTPESRFFLKRAPFTVSGGDLRLEAVRPAYAVLDAFHHGSVDGHASVTAIIEESRQLQELQDLFELYISDYLMLQRCSEELLYLKSLWDTVSAAAQLPCTCWQGQARS